MRTRVVDTQCGSDIITFPDSLCAGLDVHEMASTQDLGHEFTKSPLSKTMRGESEALLVEEMVDAVYDSNYQPTYDDFPDYDCDYDVLSAPGVVIFDGSPGVYTSSKTAESEHAVINPVIYSSHCSEEMGANIDLLEKKCDGRDEGSDRSDLDYYEEGDGGNYCDYDTVPFEPDVSDAEEDSEAGSVAQSKLSDYRSISCEVLSTLSSFDPPLNSPAVPPIQGLRNEASVEDSSNGMSLLQRLRIRTGVSIDTKSSQGARVGSADAFTHRVMQPAAIGNAAVSATASKRRNADRPAMIPSLDDRNRKDTPIPGIGAGSVMPASEGAQSERRTVDMPDGWERDWEVVLLVDIREKENVVIQTHLLGRGIPCETTQLVLGDFLWAARRIGVPNPSSSLLYTEEATCDEDGTTVDTELDASVATSSAAKKSAKKKAKKPPKKSDEGPIDLVVLDCIVERKTTKDLAASIRDGRYKEQKRRLLRCGCRVPLYVVEGLTLSAGRPGFGGGGSRGVNAAALESSIISTQVLGKFCFHACGRSGYCTSVIAFVCIGIRHSCVSSSRIGSHNFIFIFDTRVSHSSIYLV
jgi:ERCC4-type nuclease